ncbi:NUDIX hydrolase [Peribacillus kribbensis]|uniref:NUDIX hydrolase n=1 Tax=Peribacillus kribbensis TaxID=356658 RepID=UPI0003F50464
MHLKRRLLLGPQGRELKEETKLDGLLLKHFGVYDEIDRNPRGWMISNAFYAIVPEAHIQKLNFLQWMR